MRNARERLYIRYSRAELRDEIRKTAELLLDRQQWAWRVGEMVAFAIPAVGFIAALWNLRIEGNTLPYREIGTPLLVSIVEALAVLWVALAVNSAAARLLTDWEGFAEAMAVAQPVEGLRPHPSTDKDAEEAWSIPPELLPPHPPPVPAPAHTEATVPEADRPEGPPIAPPALPDSTGQPSPYQEIQRGVILLIPSRPATCLPEVREGA